MKRRHFIERALQSGTALSLLGLYACKASEKEKKQLVDPLNHSENNLFFKISLAQWSLHRAFKSGKESPLNFAALSRGFGCEGLEYVSQFFQDKAQDKNYLTGLNTRAQAEGQQNVLIMIDDEGSLADARQKSRLQAVENHYKWVEAAHFLGCHAIRVNLAGGTDKAEAVKAGVDSLNRLSDFAKDSNVSILVENHGGFSSDGQWMTEVFSQISRENCGTLPDFGNFCLTENYGSINSDGCDKAYDVYQGMRELMPYAKAVSAKSYDFDENGNHIKTDYRKILKIVKEAGYRGFIGIEYEGNKAPEEKGIELTRNLLLKIGKELS
ncbi:MAG: TIM barrel protein [Lutibacter sp.]|jgi:sugar phosphate isomerase/epimerase|nr:TIM barrel protein [Lutibacter sp.]